MRQQYRYPLSFLPKPQFTVYGAYMWKCLVLGLVESRFRSERDIDANVDAKPPHRQMFWDGEFSRQQRGLKILVSPVSWHRNWDDGYLAVQGKASDSSPSLIPPSIVLASCSHSWMGRVWPNLQNRRQISVLGQIEVLEIRQGNFIVIYTHWRLSLNKKRHLIACFRVESRRPAAHSSSIVHYCL